MEAFSRTKASLVLTVCEKGAPSSTSTKVPSVLMLCQLGAPTSKRQESILVQASARNKASLVLMV